MSDKFNLHVLRRLYNKEGRGSGVEGETRRIPLKVTLTPTTRLKLSETVPVQKGGYGSPAVELSVRIMLAMVGQVEPKYIGTELAYAIKDRSEAIKNLKQVLHYLENPKT